jgi:uncharacterized protein YndB with AHSA1/START domain
VTQPAVPPLRIERTFAASVEAVFDAWTSVDLLRRWWPAGPGWTTPYAEVDLRVGGVLRLVMRDPDGQEYGGEGHYVEISRPGRLAFTWRWDDPELAVGDQLVEVTFTSAADGATVVVLTNSGLTGEAIGSHEEGWQASFDNLDRILATGAPARGVA